MPSPKKSTPTPLVKKTVVPSPKYANGQLVFIIDFGRSGSGDVLQAEVLAVWSAKFPVTSESGKVMGHNVAFLYDLKTAYGNYREKSETAVYPTLTAVSIAFTNRFVHLLK